jgi:hypothetical protein
MVLPSGCSSVLLTCMHSWVLCRVRGLPHLVYVMDDAVDEALDAIEAAVPIPPCCVLLEEGAGAKLDLIDRGAEVGIVSIRPDDVLLQTRSSVANEKCNSEVLDFLAKALAVRRSTLSVWRCTSRACLAFGNQRACKLAGLGHEAVLLPISCSRVGRSSLEKIGFNKLWQCADTGKC